jgi:hypothetical protein
MSEWNARPLVKALLRAWWIIVGVAVVAGATAYVAVGESEPAWQGDAVLSIDSATVSRFVHLPVPERLLAEVQSAEFKAGVLDRAGVSGGELAFFTTGNPQTEFHVRYTGVAEDVVRTVTDTAARAVVERYLAMGESGLSRVRLDIKAAEDMRDVLQDTVDDPRLSPYERLDVRYRMYTLDTIISSNRLQLEQQEAAYSYNGEPTITALSQDSERVKVALGAAFAGLVLAVLFVLVRNRPRGPVRAG